MGGRFRVAVDGGFEGRQGEDGLGLEMRWKGSTQCNTSSQRRANSETIPWTTFNTTLLNRRMKMRRGITFCGSKSDLRSIEFA